jgi:succinoglycan biosynthesis transport protein ExoP
MTLAQLWIVIRGRWRSALCAACAVLLLVLGGSLLLRWLAPGYSGTAALVLDVKSPDPIAGTVLPGQNDASSYMGTQVEVVQSERVALRVIDALHLDRDPELHADWLDDTEGRGDYRAWLAERIVRKLDVKPGRESNVINIKYTARTPERAAAVANAFVDAYMEVALQLRVEPARQFNSFFDDRSRQLRESLEAAQNKLSAYQREHGLLTTSDERLDAENQRLTELTQQLVQMQAQAADSSSRHQAARAGGAMPEAMSSPLLVTLTAELSRQEALVNQLRSRLGEQNPQLREAEANVAQIRDRVAAESRRLSSGFAVNERVDQSRVAQLKAAVEEQRGRLLKLKAQRDEAAVLQRDVENAQKAYDTVATRVSQTQIESQMTRTNVSVLKRASVPPTPSTPNLLLNGAAGLLLALLVGGMTAVLRELRDPRLRTDEDVRLALQQPLLGALPLRGERKLRAGGLRQRLLIGAPRRALRQPAV